MYNVKKSILSTYLYADLFDFLIVPYYIYI